MLKETIDVLLPITPLFVAIAAIALKEGFSNKKLNEIDKRNTEDHKTIFDQMVNLTNHVSRNKAILNRYRDNEAFYTSIEETIEEALTFLEDEKARQYINFVGRSIINFVKEINVIGILKVKNKTVYTKASGYIANAMALNKQYFGNAFSKKYFNQYSNITTDYLEDVCKISEDNVNDKNKRFRSITMVYIETVASVFVNFYLKHEKLINN